jgi:hypothetical protein
MEREQTGKATPFRAFYTSIEVSLPYHHAPYIKGEGTIKSGYDLSVFLMLIKEVT